MTGGVTADRLAQSVRDYRAPATIDADRAAIREWWAPIAVANQFAAMVKNAELLGGRHGD